MIMSKYSLRNALDLRSKLKPTFTCPGRSLLLCVLCLLSLLALSGCSIPQYDDAGSVSIDDEALTEVQDVVYSVDKDGELLSEVVEWFTADINNTAAVARINDLSPDSFLTHGQFVRIPRYMLKEQNK